MTPNGTDTDTCSPHCSWAIHSWVMTKVKEERREKSSFVKQDYSWSVWSSNFKFCLCFQCRLLPACTRTITLYLQRLRVHAWDDRVSSCKSANTTTWYQCACSSIHKREGIDVVLYIITPPCCYEWLPQRRRWGKTWVLSTVGSNIVTDCCGKLHETVTALYSILYLWIANHFITVSAQCLTSPWRLRNQPSGPQSYSTLISNLFGISACALIH